MLFNSLHFLIFLPIVIGLYFTLKPKWRWILLLIASYYFYMTWKAEYVILILFSTIIDYVIALKLPNAKTRMIKNSLLGISLLVNLGLLFTFKYFNFISDSFQSVLSTFGIPFSQPMMNFLLPVGISFYTFQTLAYTIDVYRGKVQPEKHFGIFAVYVSFFPQLVAGPIERPGNLIPQLKQTFSFSYNRTIYGLSKILLGLVKKIVIADRLAIIVDLVYQNPVQFSGFEIVIATIFFAIQIYCDFSGYSDIAIGSARIMGIKLMENFRQPYFAHSIADFWRRWHISLSTWFSDYVYIPMGGNRVKLSRWVFNIFVVFLVSGLWHGANWTFVFWGGLHGLYLIIPRILKLIPLVNKIQNYLASNIYGYITRIIWTNIFVLFAWIFFRASDLNSAFEIVKIIFTTSAGWFNLNWTITFSDMIIAASVIFGLIIHDIIKGNEFKITSNFLFKAVISIAAILLIFFMGVNTGTQFIYFQF